MDKIKLTGARRVWMITDTHLGVRNSLDEWVEIHKSYFFDEFLPLVREHHRPGDLLFHMGDVFDSRHAITLKVMDLALDIFEQLAEIFVDGIFVLCGNHDIYLKSSNRINSLRPLRMIKGVHVIDQQPAEILVAGARFLMMPWQKDHAADLDAVAAFFDGQDYLMCHMDVYGMKGSRFNTIESGAPVRAFSMFKRVYSGHIHYRQQMENVCMLGTPYELTRSDMYNQKCVVLLDPATGEEKLFPNRTSPRFINIAMSRMLEMSPKELKDAFRNNFVDVHVDSPNFLRIPVNSIVDLLDGQMRSISFIPPSFQVGNEPLVSNDGQLRDFDVRDVIRQFCEESEFDQSTKDHLLSALLKLYEKSMETITFQEESVTR